LRSTVLPASHVLGRRTQHCRLFCPLTEVGGLLRTVKPSWASPRLEIRDPVSEAGASLLVDVGVLLAFSQPILLFIMASLRGPLACLCCGEELTERGGVNFPLLF
jgi:hypothetical protein